ncbi:MAG: aldehyde dehydrogenase family protein [Deltaproteobacteria bacterium]|jgi:succinate-semialdehyde dehydrogenase|nr:aldehyde dehydrogenase family protein [Deltaproteobacteria bacterium]
MSTIDEMVIKARAAMNQIRDYTQEQADKMVKVIGKVVYDHAEELAKEAVEETRFGAVEPKTMKNSFFSAALWQHLKGKPSVGILSEDPDTGITEICHPIGVVASITPVTVPNICPMGNSMLALKGKNAIIIGPSPNSKKSSGTTVKLMRSELEKIGAPADLIQVIEEPTLESSRELMSKCDVVVATGGPGLVKAAYQSGKPAFGVGPGNSQVIVEHIDDYSSFAKETILSRSYDHGTACLCIQAMIYQRNLEMEIQRSLEAEKAFFIDDQAEIDKIRQILFIDGVHSKKMAGQNAVFVATAAGLKIPPDTSILVLKMAKFGPGEVLCEEKVCPVMLAYAYDDFDEAIKIALANYEVAGKGHTGGIYSNNRDHIIKAGIAFPVSRFMVNQATTDGGSGPKNYLTPSNSLGCGSWGNNSISENLTYKHLLNIQKVSFPVNKPPMPADPWA